MKKPNGICITTISRPTRLARPGPAVAPAAARLVMALLAEKRVGTGYYRSVEEFPYAMRLVSEVLSSNGSTSQGSICGSTLGSDGCRRSD